jgi:hypothetical protein
MMKIIQMRKCVSKEKQAVKQQANCLQCKNLHNCGTVNRWLVDCGKIELSKRLSEKSDNCNCLNFGKNAAIGLDLSDVLSDIVEISKIRKSCLKSKA